MMTNIEKEIRPLEAKDFQAFFSYLAQQISDNGKNGTPLFQPVSRSVLRFPQEKEDSFKEGLIIPVGQSKWRRAWIATTEEGGILGHIDMRALSELHTEHRALLGMGIIRSGRGRGLGRRLIETAESWIANDTAIERIDLWVLSNNAPAIALYQSTGFHKHGEIEDMFRIDGISESHTFMSKKI